MELDARRAPDGTTHTADVCVVGAGPAGLSLAHELIAKGLEVLLLESGGYQAEPEVEALNAGEVSGDEYQDLRLSRSRRLGGTAAIWNTWYDQVHYAKYVPLDELDFEQRAWVPCSGWPFRRAALEPYYRRAHQLCGLGPFEYGGMRWSDAGHPLLRFGPGGLTSGVFHYGPANRFTSALPAELAASSRTMLVHGATITELARRGDRVVEARWATCSGRTGAARASSFVLAAGAIENARLLLLSGSESDWLGRGFMEHPIDRSLEFTTRAPELHPSTGFYGRQEQEGHPPVLGRIGLSEELLRERKLRNASLRLELDDEPRILQSVPLRSAAHRLLPAARLRRALGGAVRRAAGLARRFQGTRYRLLLDLEQGPQRENRVVLSPRRDALGQPLAALHWRFGPEDRTNLSRVRTIIARELELSAAGKVRINTEQPLDPNAHHHSGTTRMHEDPSLGVVDANLRMHGGENLFVTGASVFPTAGFANPTLTAVALSLRLADYLAPGKLA